MNIKEKKELNLQHSQEKHCRWDDHIKTLLLNGTGWTQKQIFQAFQVRYETAQGSLNNYKNSEKLKNGRSQSRSNSFQAAEPIRYLEVNTYIEAEHIGTYIEQRLNVKFSILRIINRLESNRVFFKKTKRTPATADSEKHAKFIKYYEDCSNNLPEVGPVKFADKVNPTIAAKITYVWIRKRQDKLIVTTASRTCSNLLGTINLESMQTALVFYEIIDSKALKKPCIVLHKNYRRVPKIHQFLKRGPYSINKDTREVAEKHGAVFHYLSSWSFNLNSIGRLWEVMNELVRNDRTFKYAWNLGAPSMNFFTKWPEISYPVVEHVNDNFQNTNKFLQAKGVYKYKL